MTIILVTFHAFFFTQLTTFAITPSPDTHCTEAGYVSVGVWGFKICCFDDGCMHDRTIGWWYIGWCKEPDRLFLHVQYHIIWHVLLATLDWWLDAPFPQAWFLGGPPLFDLYQGHCACRLALIRLCTSDHCGSVSVPHRPRAVGLFEDDNFIYFLFREVEWDAMTLPAYTVNRYHYLWKAYDRTISFPWEKPYVK